MQNEEKNQTNETENSTKKQKKPLFGNFDFVYGFLLGLAVMFIIGGSTFYVYFFGIPPFLNDLLVNRGAGNASLTLASASELQTGDKGYSLAAEGADAGTETGGSAGVVKSSVNMAAITRKLGMLQSILDQNYLFPEDPDKAATYIYKGLLASLTDDDPYAHYYSAEEMRESKSSKQSTYHGIGAMVQQLEGTNEIVVTKVYEGSPAEEAGLQVGDVLYKVDGIDISGMSISYVLPNLIQGEDGTTFNCVVKRYGQEISMRISRGNVEVPRIRYGTLDEIGIDFKDLPSETSDTTSSLSPSEVGYLSFANFYDVEERQAKQALDTLVETAKIKALIIDLRGNGGGDIEVASSLLDYILPDDLTKYTDGNSGFQQGKTLFAYTRDKNGKGQEWYAGDGHEIDIPIVVLQNQNSASAAELFSGCLKDYGRATIVGTKSYGKGIVQTITSLQDGSAVEFTTHYYYIPSGQNIHRLGITPDISVELGSNAEEYMVTLSEDRQMLAAVDAIRKNF
ncbi:S41 family peptidase [Oribacterium sp. P6A1]|uniref:S41 family peptidase n=1 Tax=Oribacterium sp. P6A1 TaxID=1410612 RepID=UPI00068CEEC3|nr:S41 family peptidase [Oribacterium sp. P6A1]